MYIVLLILFSYIAHIFIARYINIVLYKFDYKNNNREMFIDPFLWFYPTGIIILTFDLLEHFIYELFHGSRFINWFTIKDPKKLINKTKEQIIKTEFSPGFHVNIINVVNVCGNRLRTKKEAYNFRTKYVNDYNRLGIGNSDGNYFKVELDFDGVDSITPSFANEAFAYFTKFIKPKDLLKRLIFKNCSKVQLAIIHEEINSGYKK